MAQEFELERLRNAKVVDFRGEKLGAVGEIFLNDRTQLVSFITVSLGLFRMREVYVPFEAVRVTDDVVSIQRSKQFVMDAPRSNALGYLTKEQERDLRAFYADTPDPCMEPVDHHAVR